MSCDGEAAWLAGKAADNAFFEVSTYSFGKNVIIDAARMRRRRSSLASEPKEDRP
jgi:hypothetical protein